MYSYINLTYVNMDQDRLDNEMRKKNELEAHIKQKELEESKQRTLLLFSTIVW